MGLNLTQIYFHLRVHYSYTLSMMIYTEIPMQTKHILQIQMIKIHRILPQLLVSIQIIFTLHEVTEYIITITHPFI